MKYFIAFLSFFVLFIFSCSKNSDTFIGQPINPTVGSSIDTTSNLKISTFLYDLSDYPYISYVNLSQGIDGGMASMVYYAINNSEHIILTPQVSAGDYHSPIHIVKKDTAWKIEDYRYGALMDGVRNYSVMDNKGTVAYANYGSELNQGNGFYGNVWISKTNQDNTLEWQKLSNITARYHFITTGDINGDGVPDVVVNHMGIDPFGLFYIYPSDDGLITYMSKNGQYIYDTISNVFPTNNESNVIKKEFGNGQYTRDCFIMKYNKDSLPILVRTMNTSVLVYKFNPITKRYTNYKIFNDDYAFKNDPMWGSTSMKSADFNGDGNPDVAIAFEANPTNQTYTGLSIWYGDGKGNFSCGKVMSMTDSKHNFREFEAGDINGDGKPDIFLHVMGCLPTADNTGVDLNPYILFNDGLVKTPFKNPTNAILPFSIFSRPQSGGYTSPIWVKGFFNNGKLKLLGFRGDWEGSGMSMTKFRLMDISFKQIK